MNKDIKALIGAYEKISNAPITESKSITIGGKIFDFPESKDVTIDGKNYNAVDLEIEESHTISKGVHKGLRYGYCVEIDGNKLKTKNGVRCGREHCGGLKLFLVEEDGSIWKLY